MDLRKYSVSEFSEMLENEMKLNKEKCEKIAKYANSGSSDHAFR